MARRPPCSRSRAGSAGAGIGLPAYRASLGVDRLAENGSVGFDGHVAVFVLDFDPGGRAQRIGVGVGQSHSVRCSIFVTPLSQQSRPSIAGIGTLIAHRTGTGWWKSSGQAWLALISGLVRFVAG